MNIHAYDRLWEKAKDPTYVEFIEKVLPAWFSYAPGGINYLPDQYSIDERLTRWYQAGVRVNVESERLGVRIDGYPARRDEYPTDERVAVKHSQAKAFRKVVHGWKDVMRSLGLDPSGSLRRVPGDEDQSVEWNHFHFWTQQLWGKA